MSSRGEVTSLRLIRIGLALGALAVSGARGAQASNQQSDARQEFVPPGWSVEQELTGDLNKDGIPDAVLMLVEEGHRSPTDEAHRILLVLAGRGDGSFDQIGVSKKVLLCVQCFGMLGGAPRLSIQHNVLVVEQESGSRETVSGLWRFRFDPRSGRMRLIGFDVKNRDRATGLATFESTNYLNGKRINESLRYDAAKGREIVLTRKTSSVDTAPHFLEDVQGVDGE